MNPGKNINLREIGYMLRLFSLYIKDIVLLFYYYYYYLAYSSREELRIAPDNRKPESSNDEGKDHSPKQYSFTASMTWR